MRVCLHITYGCFHSVVTVGKLWQVIWPQNPRDLLFGWSGKSTPTPDAWGPLVQREVSRKSSVRAQLSETGV